MNKSLHVRARTRLYDVGTPRARVSRVPAVRGSITKQAGEHVERIHTAASVVTVPIGHGAY